MEKALPILNIVCWAIVLVIALVLRSREKAGTLQRK